MCIFFFFVCEEVIASEGGPWCVNIQRRQRQPRGVSVSREHPVAREERDPDRMLRSCFGTRELHWSLSG